MVGSKYVCPLCKQPVSSSLYMKITGIWQVREKEVAKVKEERAKLKKEQAQFKLQKAKLVKDTANKTAKQYEIKFRALKQREHNVESEANRKVAAAFRAAHNKAELDRKNQMLLFEKKMKVSMTRQLKTARIQASAEAKLKYNRIERSLKSNLTEFKGDNLKLSKSNLKLNERIVKLEKQLEDQATPQMEGFIYEKELMKELEKKFPDDEFVNTGKGGDVIQSVVKNKEVIGTIVYECKRVKHYASKHVKQTWDAQRKRKADFGVLVTNAMKKGTNGFFVERGVLVVHGTAVLYVAGILRRQIIQLSEMKLGQAEREKAVKGILNYLESPDFTNSVDSIVQDSITLYKGLMDEMRKHFKVWKDRYSLYSRINSEANAIQNNTKALLSGRDKEEKKVSKLPALLELPEAAEDNEEQ